MDNTKLVPLSFMEFEQVLLPKIQTPGFSNALTMFYLTPKQKSIFIAVTWCSKESH